MRHIGQRDDSGHRHDSDPEGKRLPIKLDRTPNGEESLQVFDPAG